jgi:hypothetical protein
MSVHSRAIAATNGVNIEEVTMPLGRRTAIISLTHIRCNQRLLTPEEAEKAMQDLEEVFFQLVMSRAPILRC